LLTNLKKSPDDGIYRFRVPLETLGNALGNLAQFIQNHRYTGPTLFITGGISPYRKPFESHPELVDQQFPNARVEVMPGCGHWLHAEKPDLFLSLVSDFIAASEQNDAKQQQL
jgi:pimeloyl-ACP methyl ester carboxylesterase